LQVFDTNGQPITSFPKPTDIQRAEALKTPFQFDVTLDGSDNPHVAYLFADSCIVDKYDIASHTISRTRLLLPDRLGIIPSSANNILPMFGRDGYLYILLTPMSRLYKIDLQRGRGVKLRLMMEDLGVSPSLNSLAIDAQGGLIVADQATGKLARLVPKPFH
jgi:hypothetical protein